MPQGLGMQLGLGGGRSATPSGAPAGGPGSVTRQSELLAWWKFNSSSGTTAYDSTDNEYDLTLQNMEGDEWVPGKETQFGNALRFDGTDEFASSDTSGSGPDFKTLMGSNWTVSLWFIVTDTTTATQAIFNNGDNPDPSGESTPVILLQYSSTTTLRWLVADAFPAALTWTTTGVHNVDRDAWHHVAMTYDGTTYRGYLDGVANGTYTAGLSIYPGPYVMVGEGWNVAMFGKADDFRIYEAALEASDIADIYGGGNGDFP